MGRGKLKTRTRRGERLALAFREMPLSDSPRSSRPALAATAAVDLEHSRKAFQRSDDFLDDLRIFLERAPLYDEHELEPLQAEAAALRTRFAPERARLEALPYCDAKWDMLSKLGFVYALLGNFLAAEDVDYLGRECRHYRSGAGGYDSIFYALERELTAVGLRRLDALELDRLETAVSALAREDDYLLLEVEGRSAPVWLLRGQLRDERRRRAGKRAGK